MEQLNQGNTAQLADTLTNLLIPAREPAFVWGSPGIGKSQMVRQIAAKLDAPVIDIRASQLDSVDTRGIPYIVEGFTHWAQPGILPTKAQAAKHDIMFIFFDELNAAAPAVQAALYQLILERMLGEYVLPDNVYIIAAGNLESDKAVTHRMSTALADRFFHLELTVDVEAWQAWALDNNIYLPLIGFYALRPELLHKWEANTASKSQGTPRGAEKVSNVLKISAANGLSGTTQERIAVCGKLGNAIGTELLGFLRLYDDMPNLDAILLDPTGSDIPNASDVLYAITTGLSHRATVDNYDAVCLYMDRVSQEKGGEFGVLLHRSATKRDAALTKTRAFIQWASDNQGVLI